MTCKAAFSTCSGISLVSLISNITWVSNNVHSGNLVLYQGLQFYLHFFCRFALFFLNKCLWIIVFTIQIGYCKMVFLATFFIFFGRPPFDFASEVWHTWQLILCACQAKDCDEVLVSLDFAFLNEVAHLKNIEVGWISSLSENVSRIKCSFKSFLWSFTSHLLKPFCKPQIRQSSSRLQIWKSMLYYYSNIS